MTKPLVYCDYNAGAPVRPEAAAAVARALGVGGNPSSVHGAGRAAKALMEDAREKIAASIGALVENLVFTSGATEALHLALSSAGAASVIISAVEHDALYEHASRTYAAHLAPVDEDGVLDLSSLAALLEKAPKPALVAVQLANNETGVIQPVTHIAALAREHGALLLVDAAQALGRLPVSIADLDATYLVLSSHKIGGPAGAGALALAPGAPFVTSRFGGGQERGRRPGTENVAAIAGFGAAAEIAASEQQREAARLIALRDCFEAGLPNDAVVFGAHAPRLPNTSNFALPGLNAETAVIAMDIAGVAVSSGAACSSGKVRSSRVLAAMGVKPDLAKSALRVSFGWASNDADVDRTLSALRSLAARRAFAGAA
ncbi:MAG: cysteine desulfurase family protein [Hyphomonadaceae bacterium]|nr:cysteine desulfurase family protein [Hyphomonadaceae bacterium]